MLDVQAKAEALVSIVCIEQAILFKDVAPDFQDAQGSDETGFRAAIEAFSRSAKGFLRCPKHFFAVS